PEDGERIGHHLWLPRIEDGKPRRSFAVHDRPPAPSPSIPLGILARRHHGGMVITGADYTRLPRPESETTRVRGGPRGTGESVPCLTPRGRGRGDPPVTKFR